MDAARPEARLEEGLRSILRFIRRTAEPAGVGRCWTTIDYENRPHRDISLFNGASGVSLLLMDAAGSYGQADDLALAAEAIDWCHAFEGKRYRRGLHTGMTGVAWAELRLSRITGAPVPQRCLRQADLLLAESPGPITDLLGGAASNGLYLLRLWEATRDPAHLRGAVLCAEWLEQQMSRDERGTTCLTDPQSVLGFPREVYLGEAHGLTGIAHFLVLLAEGTASERWANLSRELFDTVIGYARPIHGGVNWPPGIGRETMPRCQWSHGAAGMGLGFFPAARILGESKYLQIGLQAAEATYAYGDLRSNPTFCTGLTGGGELLVRAYEATQDPLWRERAVDFALRCLAYREETPGGDAWPTDTQGLHSVDYEYGAAGVGHFFLRILSEGKVSLPLY